MNIIVQKFGGACVADTAKIANLVTKVQREIDASNKVIVVVSAMAGITKKLISFCYNLNSELYIPETLAEYDSALSSGEIMTASLFALALQQKSIKSRSLHSWQIPIKTNNYHSKAIIIDINTNLIHDMLLQGIVPVISGFQGITNHNRITTLGRGGSDITAVAIAAALQAKRCDIYTTVDGIFSADPELIPQACKHDKIAYTEMLELASLGARVIHHRAVQMGMRYNVPIKVIHAFSKGQGTTIQEITTMEQPQITGITYNKDIILVTIYINDNKQFFLVINHMLKYSVSIEQITNYQLNKVSIIIPLSDLAASKKAFDELQNQCIINSYQINNVASVSVVGYAIKYNPSIFQQITMVLSKFEVQILGILALEARISIILNKIDVEPIVAELHHHLILTASSTI